MNRLALALAALLGLGAGPAAAQVPVPVSIVAAENFYGDVARQIGGDAVDVASVLSNPDQDPHLFEASAAVARELAAARLVIVNGADYDPWMAKLLKAATSPGRRVIEVAALVRRKPGDNPHLWYDPATMPALARALAAELAALDPAHAADFQRRLSAFTASLAPLAGKVAEMKRRYAGQPATATEPVFGYMAEALGLKMRNGRFQLAVMNDTEPRASDVAAFEADLKGRRVRVLLYNSQTSGALTRRLQALAQDSKVPVVGVTETEPAGLTYQEWMMRQLMALDLALAGPAS